MDEPIYTLPENPVYQEKIRRLQNSDFVDAEAVYNPLLEAILGNIHYLYKRGDAGRKVVAARVRDPTLPAYGLDVRDDGTIPAVLESGAYTGTAEVSAIVSGVEYDAGNMSANGENVPDGTLIITKLEEE